MEYVVLLLDEAENELDEAFIWYESQKIGLGIEFVDSLNKAFEFLKKHPEASAKKKKSVYRYVMSRFPFGIYYILDKKLFQVQVIAILHFKRKPGIWRKRLKK
jgi:plasmid stabilization system protein ParE